MSTKYDIAWLLSVHGKRISVPLGTGMDLACYPFSLKTGYQNLLKPFPILNNKSFITFLFDAHNALQRHIHLFWIGIHFSFKKSLINWKLVLVLKKTDQWQSVHGWVRSTQYRSKLEYWLLKVKICLCPTGYRYKFSWLQV